MAHIQGPERWQTQEDWDSFQERRKTSTKVLQEETRAAAEKVRASYGCAREKALTDFERLIQERKDKLRGEQGMTQYLKEKYRLPRPR